MKYVRVNLRFSPFLKFPRSNNNLSSGQNQSNFAFEHFFITTNRHKRIMNYLCALLFLFLTFSFAAQAKTVRVSDFGVIPNDGMDDTEFIQAAVADLIANGGGTLIFPSGTTDLKGDVRFQTYQNYQSYRLTGDRGAFIRLGGNENTNYFMFGNVNQAEFDGLIFYANNDRDINAQRVVSSNHTTQTEITNCSFFGIGASVAIVDAQSTDLIVKKTQFEGNAANQGVIHAQTARSVSVSNTTFIDYANFLDMYLSKTGQVGTVSWINIENENPTYGANGQRIVRITDCRFDEGAWKAIKIKNQKTAEISGINVNVSGTTGGAGVSLDNVEYAEIKFSAFGYPSQPRPAIELYNRSNIEATALTFSDAVFFIQRDKTSTYTVKFCGACFAR